MSTQPTPPTQTSPTPAHGAQGKVMALMIAIAGVSLLTTLMIAMFALNRARLSNESVPTDAASQTIMSFGQAPSFELTERSGRIVNSKELSGKIWLASFTFTRCLGVCPVMNARAKQLQDAILAMPGAEDVVLVSFTVDPDNDTPEVLAAKAKQMDADVNRWLWLHGPRDKVWSIAGKGFKLAVEEDPGNPDMPIAHSSKFVIVDRNGQIHGYYDSLDPKVVETVLAELRLMLEKK